MSDAAPTTNPPATTAPEAPDAPDAPEQNPAPPPVVVRHAGGAREQFHHWFDLVVLEVRKSYARSAIGLGWAVAEPLLFVGMYYFLFAVILEAPYDGPGGTLGYLLKLFSGLVPWLFFSRCFSLGAAILQTHGPLVKQINFPIHLLPFVSVAQSSVEFIISLGILFCFSLAAGLVTTNLLILPPAILLLSLFLVGTGYMLACYNTLLPDLAKVIPTILRAGMWITPVVYLPSDFPDSVRWIAEINPLSYLIAPFRHAFLPGVNAFVFSPLTDMLIATGITAGTLLLAWCHRNFVRRVVVDYL
jgi:ABC-type polysaccharide/polyol phosphate export permease